MLNANVVVNSEMRVVHNSNVGNSMLQDVSDVVELHINNDLPKNFRSFVTVVMMVALPG